MPLAVRHRVVQGPLQRTDGSHVYLSFGQRRALGRTRGRPLAERVGHARARGGDRVDQHLRYCSSLSALCGLLIGLIGHSAAQHSTAQAVLLES